MLLSLNNIDAKILSPIACQNVIVGRPNMVGINQFHNNCNGKPNKTPNKAITENANSTLVSVSAVVNCFIIKSGFF